MICPIIPVPHCIRVFFYFVWFVFINHIFHLCIQQSFGGSFVVSLRYSHIAVYKYCCVQIILGEKYNDINWPCCPCFFLSKKLCPKVNCVQNRIFVFQYRKIWNGLCEWYRVHCLKTLCCLQIELEIRAVSHTLLNKNMAYRYIGEHWTLTNITCKHPLLEIQLCASDLTLYKREIPSTTMSYVIWFIKGKKIAHIRKN